MNRLPDKKADSFFPKLKWISGIACGIILRFHRIIIHVPTAIFQTTQQSKKYMHITRGPTSFNSRFPEIK